MNQRILTINPGSTSTKIAVFDGETQVFIQNIKHPSEEIARYNSIVEQYEFRKDNIVRVLGENNIALNSIGMIVARGGLVKNIPSGIYEVNEAMLADLREGVNGQHASNLGGIIAADLAKNIGCKAYIADPVVVDELCVLAKYSGHPDFPRKPIFHALNQKAIARTYAKEQNRKYEDLNLIVVHLGGGISVGAHEKGLVIDSNQALDGDGPFSPERTGTLPMGLVVDACYSGKYTREQMRKILVGKGGYVGYLGSNDAYEVEQRAAAGDKKAAEVEEAMIYQVAKEVGAMACVLKGKVDAILVTGGIAHSKSFVKRLTERVGFIAPVSTYPGEDEMRALAMNGLMAMKGELQPKEYK